MEKNNHIDDWLSQETTAEEREELERMISFTETLSVPELTSKENAWEKLISNIEEQAPEKEQILVPQKKKTSTWLIWTSSVAAALVIGYFSLFYNSADGVMTLNSGIAQTVTELLPDNSEILLNAGSVASFDKNEWSQVRSISLTGEAFFNVTEGEAFTVITNAGTVTVLGTSFNVFSRNDELSVQCFTGKVRVDAKGESVILTANQSAAIDAQTGRLTVQEFNPEKAATWRNGEFYFDAVELSEVIAELERQFDITIEVTGDISNRFYTGFFSKQSLTEALQLVFVPMGLATSVNGSIVTVE